MNRDVPSSFDYSGACDGIGGLFRSLVYSFDVSPHSGTSGGQGAWYNGSLRNGPV